MVADLRAFAWSFVAYRPHVPPVQWAESNLLLSPLVSETPGPYSTRLHPWVREPLEALADSKTTDVAFCWCAQGGGKTTTISVGLLYRLLHNPTPTLFVLPSIDLAQSFSESRLAPLLDSCEALSRLKPKDRTRFKKTEWLLDTATVNFVGANSPANLASRPAGLLICDETDKFPEASAKEAGAIQLAVERTKAFASAKRVFTSTPTTQTGEIWQRFLKGDQRYFHVPCPHCNELIRLEWPQVKWDAEAKDEKTEAWDYARVLKSAHYVCQKCTGRIEDQHKTKMLRAGVWIPTNPAALPGWRSYHLNGLYSTSQTFGRLAIKWLEAQDNLSELQGFINSTLAEPWIEHAIKITEEKLLPLLGSNERGAFDPKDLGHNLAAVDVQQTYFAFVVRRFYPGGKSHLIDWGMVPGYAEIDAVFAKYGVRMLAMDSSEGARAAEVYREVARRPGAWIAVKGGVMSEFLRPVQIDPFTGTRDANQTRITLLHISDPLFTDELLNRLSGKTAGWRLTKAIDLLYQKQIMAVYKAERKRRNGTTEVKIKNRGANHLFDCEKILLALASACQLDRPAVPPSGDNKSAPQVAAPEGKIEF